MSGVLRTLRRLVYWSLLAACFCVGAEITARLDDWMQSGIPLLHTPNNQRDLTVTDSLGTRGRPKGHFKKWQLNEYGFRGPGMSHDPAPGHPRVLVLGSSETFGLYETERKEYPAQLADLLKGREDYEVVNAAVAGMTIKSMVGYWENWCCQFRPSLVVVYPDPLFYLNDQIINPAAAAAEGRSAEGSSPEARGAEAPGWRSRVVMRAGDLIRLPTRVRRWRVDRTLAALAAGKGGDWFFPDVPQERLDQFVADLSRLVRSIRDRGATPVVLTYAVRSAVPPRPEDLDDLHFMRSYMPRVNDETLAAFGPAANQAIVAFGRQEGVEVLDVAAELNGHREWFEDLVHFNNEGAAVMARLLAERIRGDARLTGGGGR